MIEKIFHENKMLGLIIRSSYTSDGVNFFTPNDFSQQLGYMSHDKGHIILPHLHKPVFREVIYTKEVLLVRSGCVRVDFYDDNQGYVTSYILNKGDIIMLASGGHGFEMLEPTEMIEVKQGPYAGEDDKVRFAPVLSNKITIQH